MFQNILIGLIFVAALAYLGRMIYRSFRAKSCASGCGKCGVDFNAIERQLEQKR
ncbi:MAG: FeoB-associated Cys-rich membrane protein [Cyclobacteriaceae bacterium]|nr:FeoB-associated Cys-rich membrane protein [Cyclobacteriaceae bacterium]